MKKVLAAALIAGVIISMTSIVYALTQIGFINVGYKITPTAQPPIMTPSSVSLDLGTIPSGSSGTKDFGKVATLNLPAGYEITFALDRDSASDFPTFDVTIEIFEGGTRVATVYLQNDLLYYEKSVNLAAGTYDIYISVEYQAVSVTADTSGTVTINISYPG